ncbi:MAG: hypothetical protein BGO67_10680 [Alphaproteobacteria bacterium 41-28]|nr:MAG: hypothetical protein BGO67_10680 [Alphaproteobacteria bacterium 41-28]
MKKNIKYLAAILVFISISGDQALAGKDGEEGEFNHVPVKKSFLEDKTKAGLTIAGTGLGAWIGKGIGNRVAVSLAHFLNEPEPGSYIRSIGSAVQKGNDAREWGPWGSWAGGIIGTTVGAYVMSYSDDICSSYVKLYNAIKKKDTKDIEGKDVFNVSLTVLASVGVAVDFFWKK